MSVMRGGISGSAQPSTLVHSCFSAVYVFQVTPPLTSFLMPMMLLDSAAPQKPAACGGAAGTLLAGHLTRARC